MSFSILIWYVLEVISIDEACFATVGLYQKDFALVAIFDLLFVFPFLAFIINLT